MRPGQRSYIVAHTLAGGGQIYGLCLGADYCAEHEWGIDRIARAFGIGEGSESGFASRMVTKLPSTDRWDDHRLWLIENPGATCLVYTDRLGIPEGVPASGIVASEQELPEWLLKGCGVETYMEFPTRSGGKRYRKPRNAKEEKLFAAAHPGFRTGWSRHDFGIFARGDGERAFIRSLAGALLRLDAVIGTGIRRRQGLFSGAGLSIGIASLVPEADRAAVAAFDAERAAEAALPKEADPALTALMARFGR